MHQSMQALGRLSQSSYFHKYIKNAVCSNINVGQQKSTDYRLFGWVWTNGEVGAIMIVGGNIDNATRVLTTAISLETSR